MGPLHYHSSHSDFCFEFADIFVFEKQLPAINDTGSQQLRISVIRGVANSPYQWYAESLIPRIVDMGSRLLNFFERKLSVSVKRRAVNSPHQWYSESPTPCILESGNRWLRISLIQRVDDSGYRWVGESTLPVLVSRYLKKISTKGNGCELDYCEWDLAEKWKRTNRVVRASVLTANAEVATILGSIPASSDTVKSEGWQIKQQCLIHYIET